LPGSFVGIGELVMDRVARHRAARPPRRPLDPLRDFLATEASGAILIVAAAVVALIWANSPWQHGYDSLRHRRLGFTAGNLRLGLDLHGWVNDALVTIFFFLVGLEIKREITFGNLASRRAALTPVIAAIGGMLIPAATYLAIAGRTASHGWAVPMATDIALAVGVIAVVGERIPTSLRALLLGLAVVDDIGGIIIIAAVYSTGISFVWLGFGVGAIVVAGFVRRLPVPTSPALVVLGIAAWVCLHAAGIHPTLAGVAIGLLVRAGAMTDPKPETSMVAWWEHVLHPWSSYLIVPVFALANSGIEISGDQLAAAIRSPVTWGVLLGLWWASPSACCSAPSPACAAASPTDPRVPRGGRSAGSGPRPGSASPWPCSSPSWPSTTPPSNRTPSWRSSARRHCRPSLGS